MPRYRRAPFSKRQVRAVASIARGQQEKKFLIFNQPIIYSPSGLTPLFVHLTQLAQGTTDSNRIGDTVRLNGLFVRQHIDCSKTNQGAYSMRFMIIQWLDVATPVLSDVLQSVTTVTAAVISGYRHDQASRYRILHDTVRFVSPSVDNPKSLMTISKQINFKKLASVQYEGSVISNPLNGLYFISFCNNLVQTTGNIFMKFTYRDG